MSRWLTAALLFLSPGLYAQKDSVEIINAIQTFFSGMHHNDTTLIKTTLDSSCYLHSIMQKKDGSTLLHKEKIGDFLQQVQALKGQQTHEQLLSCQLKMDGPMAIAWAPYKFFFNEKFSHCGVNVFTLIKRNNSWKIMGITDTRRLQGCDTLH